MKHVLTILPGSRLYTVLARPLSCLYVIACSMYIYVDDRFQTEMVANIKSVGVGMCRLDHTYVQAGPHICARVKHMDDLSRIHTHKHTHTYIHKNSDVLIVKITVGLAQACPNYPKDD